MSSATDQVVLLVERIQAGTDYERSCRELYHQFRRRIVSFFAVRGFSSDECAELTQETFIRVFLGIGRLHDASRFATWLFEIATNVYRNELRHRGAAKRDAFEESIEDLAEDQAAGRPDAIAALGSNAPSPLDETLHRERLESLRAKLKLLPPQMRRCVFLRLYQDLKYREIAALLRISIETVKAHLHQAQKRLMVDFPDRPDGEET
ncbi:MAG TPA: RNA polymerase sigma factor [Thermoanaerobaculia bacterium]|nr:RNA polymerase sigma factor [Thermoanaerobaculia bacterium]